MSWIQNAKGQDHIFKDDEALGELKTRRHPRSTAKTNRAKGIRIATKHQLKYFVSPGNGEISTPAITPATMYIVLVTLFAVSFVSALWPVPITYSEGNSTVVLSSDFAIQFNGPNGTSNGVDTSQKVYTAINETYALLDDGFIPYMLYPFEEDYEPAADEMAAAPQLSSLVITQT